VVLQAEPDTRVLSDGSGGFGLAGDILQLGNYLGMEGGATYRMGSVNVHADFADIRAYGLSNGDTLLHGIAQTIIVFGSVQGKVVFQKQPSFLSCPAYVPQVVLIGCSHISSGQMQTVKSQLLGFVHQAEDVPNRLPLKLEAAPVLSHAVQMKTVCM